MSFRDLNYISIERDISKTSQKHLKSDQFFVKSLRNFKYISKKMSFCDVFKTSQIHLRKDVHDISERSLKYILQVFVTYQKYPTKTVSCDFRRVIEISDKIDVEA